MAHFDIFGDMQKILSRTIGKFLDFKKVCTDFPYYVNFALKFRSA